MISDPAHLDQAFTAIAAQAQEEGIDGAQFAAAIRAKVEAGDLELKRYESGEYAVQLTERGMRRLAEEKSDGH